MKAGTNQSRSGNIGQAKGESALKSSSGVGADSLLHLLKNYARHAGGDKKASASKACITVGIIGYPNVGKSSILNTMKRSRAVGVSPRPGFTTAMQEVVLDKNLRLVDSPGVVFDDTENVNGAECMLRNCVDADSVEDPIPAVQALLNRCTTESLMMTYSIPAFPKDDAMMFLAMIAKKTGKVLKGGIPDKVTAARTVLRDWNTGKIPFYTRPPVDDEGAVTSDSVQKQDDAQILSGFGEAFDVSKMDATVLNDLKDSDAMDFVEMAPELDQTMDQSTRAAVDFLSGNGMDDGDENQDMDEDMEGTDRINSVVDAEDYDFNDL